MSLTDEFDPSSSPVEAGAPRRARVLRTLLAWVSISAAPAVLLFAGYPLLAAWVALVVCGWLFIVGARRASGD